MTKRPKKRTAKRPEIQQKAVLENNFIGTDDTAIYIDNDERDLTAAMNKSTKSAIYISPALVAIRNAVILTGSHRRAYLRSQARRDALSRLGGALREVVRVFAGSR